MKFYSDLTNEKIFLKMESCGHTRPENSYYGTALFSPGQSVKKAHWCSGKF